MDHLKLFILERLENKSRTRNKDDGEQVVTALFALLISTTGLRGRHKVSNPDLWTHKAHLVLYLICP